MTEQDIAEQAYKNGYEKGYADGKRSGTPVAPDDDRLIYVSDLKKIVSRMVEVPAEMRVQMMGAINRTKTADAVSATDMREFAMDVVYQFGCYWQNGGRLHITIGGLSTLEQAFDILGWEDPHPVQECECEIDGCHEHATCGAPTADGYKRMCGRHYPERRTDDN